MVVLLVYNGIIVVMFTIARSHSRITPPAQGCHILGFCLNSWCPEMGMDFCDYVTHSTACMDLPYRHAVVLSSDVRDINEVLLGCKLVADMSYVASQFFRSGCRWGN